MVVDHNYTSFKSLNDMVTLSPVPEIVVHMVHGVVEIQIWKLVALFRGHRMEDEVGATQMLAVQYRMHLREMEDRIVGNIHGLGMESMATSQLNDGQVTPNPVNRYEN